MPPANPDTTCGMGSIVGVAVVEAGGKRRVCVCFGVMAVLLAVLSASPVAHADHNVTDVVSIGNGGNGPFPAVYGGTSANGSRVYFTTSESLSASDTDARQDVYERFGLTTTLVSTGPAGGNGAFDAFFEGVSADGSRVHFSTDEALVAGDTDTRFDVYERSGGTTNQISNGNGAFSAFYDGASSDGTRVFFTTNENLVAADTDGRQDIYERSSGTTTLVSAGANGTFDAFFLAASQDGTRVFFRTFESFAGTDSDAQSDIYQRSGGATSHISTVTGGGNGAYPAIFGGISQDGTRVFFTTREPLTAGDSDACVEFGVPNGCADVYERASGTTTRLSVGSVGGNGLFDSTYAGSSTDGLRVFFNTGEGLVAADTDGRQDIYERSSGTTTQISTGPSGGNGAFDAVYDGASPNGTHVFFNTSEGLAGGDTDGRKDIYDRSGGTTTLASTGPAGGNAPFFDAVFDYATVDRVFFHTDEELVSGDTDGRQDIYERFGSTALVTKGPVAGFNLDHFFAGASTDGTRVFFRTNDRLAPVDSDAQQDIYQARIRFYQAPAAASPLSVGLVPVFRQCGTGANPTDGQHSPPFAASCDAPLVNSTAHAGPQSTGSAQLAVQPSDLTTVNDEADVLFSGSLTDIRSGSPAGPDYAPIAGPELTLTARWRITDLYNNPSQTDEATTTDFDFPVPGDCVATPDPLVGASCSISTTADAVTPGSAPEGKSMVIQVFRVRVNDSGADNIRGNGDDRLFAQQGFYVP
jgi:hypothetical protein